MHQIFMLAFAGLRVEGEEAQVLVVSQPPPLAFLVFLLSDWWGGPCHFRSCGWGSPCSPFRRNVEQGGGAFPRAQLRLK